VLAKDGTNSVLIYQLKHEAVLKFTTHFVLLRTLSTFYYKNQMPQPAEVKNNCISQVADPSGHALKGVGLRPLACWDCGFESHRGNGIYLLGLLYNVQ
jgi:hypothetical protein